MRETVNSLKTYFTIVAVLNAIGGTAAILVAAESPLILLPIGLLGLGFAVVYLYLRLNCRNLLIHSPGTMNAVIVANMGFQVLGFLINMLIGIGGEAVVRLVVGLLIGWYLLNSIKRLSKEEQAKQWAKEQASS